MTVQFPDTACPPRQSTGWARTSSAFQPALDEAFTPRSCPDYLVARPGSGESTALLGRIRQRVHRC